MLDQLTHGQFTEWLGNKFQIQSGGAAVLELELIEANKLPAHQGKTPPASRREPFSLIFRGPRDRWAQQGTYSLTHAQMGTASLFLVPIGSDEAGMRYEAIFN